MNNYYQFARFAIVGIIGFVVDVSVLYIALHFGLEHWQGRAVSFLCAVLTTWVINRQLTFTAHKDMPILEEAIRYLVAMSLGGIVNYVTYLFVLIQFQTFQLLPLIGVAVGSVAGMCFNYFSAKIWVFKL